MMMSTLYRLLIMEGKSRCAKSNLACAEQARPSNEIVSNPMFDLFSRVLIVLNICSMCAYKSYQPETTKRFLDGWIIISGGVLLRVRFALVRGEGILGRLWSFNRSLKQVN